MGDLELARTLGYAAADLELRGYPGHGVVRRAARRLLELIPDEDAQPPDRCRRCSTPLVQKPTGRPRIYCSDRCRKGRRLAETRTEPTM